MAALPPAEEETTVTQLAKSSVTPFFTETQCRMMMHQDISIHEFSPNVTTGWEILARKDPNFILRPNLRFINTDDYPNTQFKYFLTDVSDLELVEKIEKTKNGKRNLGEAMKSQTSMTKYGKKNLYIRAIPSEPFGRSEDPRVFVDDVIEVLTIMINRGAAKNKKTAERKLQLYKKDWVKKQTETTLLTIMMEEMIDIMGILDMDRTTLTVVEDPIYWITKKDMYDHFGYIRTCSPYCHPVVDKVQAIFMVFHSCVNGINWNKEECFKHPNCLELLKSEIMRAMRKLAELRNGTYTYVYHILAIIEEIRVYCPYRYKENRVVLDYVFPGHNATDQLDTNHVLNVVQHYGLQSANSYTIDIRVTVQRFFIQLYWINQFFTDQKDEKLRDLVCNAICFLAHEERYDFCKHHIAKLFHGKMSKSSPFRLSTSFPNEPKSLSNGVSISLPRQGSVSSDSDDSYCTEAPEFEPEPTEVETTKLENLCINCNERKKRIKKVRQQTGVLRKKLAHLHKKVLNEQTIEAEAKRNDTIIEGLNQKLLIKEEMIEERRYQGKSKDVLMEANKVLVLQIKEYTSTHANLILQKKEAIEKKEELEKENNLLEDRIKILKQRWEARKLSKKSEEEEEEEEDSGEQNEQVENEKNGEDSKVTVLKQSKTNKLKQCHQ